ncbi:amidohydrolase family protein [Roseibium porphyridii]|uniref:Amidohydrolase family protein n=1 Tax=Roseibium porphyridii TaxID=2866279 RepID=A0ABY8EYZ4_9HYPH|nr:amidohydrolase family protein [Roseibium sp. KMA01]WFE88348.1 amidohydrolase family protein [Roseibium sp. KMA01]
MIVDAHQHFWTLARGDYAWPNESVAPIFKDFGPQDLEPLLVAASVDRTVLVQATDSVDETRFLLDLAGKSDRIAAVVGWVDFASDAAVKTVQDLAKNPLLKGLRPMLQGIEQSDWILQDAAEAVLTQMVSADLRFDALVQPRHLPHLFELAKRHPGLAIVVDHLAKPEMGEGREPDHLWRMGMESLAARPNVYCKLSGMVTEIGPDWKLQDLQPFAKTILDCFGPDRVMFGSDWPVVNLASDYASWITAARSLLSGLSESNVSKIMGGTARKFYGID